MLNGNKWWVFSTLLLFFLYGLAFQTVWDNGFQCSSWQISMNVFRESSERLRSIFLGIWKLFEFLWLNLSLCIPNFQFSGTIWVSVSQISNFLAQFEFLDPKFLIFGHNLSLWIPNFQFFGSIWVSGSQIFNFLAQFGFLDPKFLIFCLNLGLWIQNFQFLGSI
jgi:hypothetical protein